MKAKKQTLNKLKLLQFIILIDCLLFGLLRLNAQTIVYPSNGSKTELFAAKEVRRYLYLRTDQKLTIQGVTSIPSSGDIILVANDDNDMVNSLRSQINHTTATGGIIIKSINSGGRTILVITGNNSESTLIAAYRFAEHLGVGFDLAGDAIPDAKIPLSLTGFDEAGERRFETTGILPFHDFAPGPDLWSMEEYLIAINQLSKMGMNFIGLHNYVTHSTYEEKGLDIRQGPEPNVWIGLQEDINTDGTVKWSYPSYYAHSHRPHTIWGTVELNTGNYWGGAADIFPRDFWGSDIFGTSAMPTDITSSNTVFNKAGQMFNTAFGFAKDIGVKTAIGTELPLGIEAKGPEVGAAWVRGMPPQLQSRLQSMGKNPSDPAVVKDVYKGIFERIMKTHHLDYFWLWSYEIWSRYGVNNAQRDAMKNDMTHAMEAANELNVPFTLGHAGWILGDTDNPALFDNHLPKDYPFYGLWDEADGFDEVSAARKKWAATWLEEDWGLVQPQLEMHRIYNDVKAAANTNCHGLIGKGWRTRTMGANTHAMKSLFWCYGPTGSAINKAFPSNKNAWIDATYLDWSTRWFGQEAANGIVNILGALDKAGEPGSLGAVPNICEWEAHTDAPNSSGSAISAQAYNASDFNFVDALVTLRSQVVGKGNLERFDYWLKTFQSFRAKAEYGGLRLGGQANRAQMATKMKEVITLDIERMVDACDIGEIMQNNVLNWHQLVQLDWGAGTNPSTTYSGESFIKVMPVRTQVQENETLKLNIVAMGVSAPTLKYRELGNNTWTTITPSNVGRSVYTATIPIQTQDFEYYLESSGKVFPVTANSSSPIYQTVVVMGNSGQFNF